MKLNVKTYSQRDSRWGSIVLGNNTDPQYSLYWYACLITSLGNYVDKTPDQVNTLLKNNGGFTQGDGNFIWSKSTVLGLNQVYVSSRCVSIDFYATELQKAKDLIKDGYPLLMEVDFNPATEKPDQHFVLGAGVSDNNELMVVDPWEGAWETWSDGAAKRNIYQFRQYDKKCLIGEDMSTLPVLKKDFENLVRKSTLYDWIINALGITDSETVVKETITKSLSYEDTIAQLEKEKRDVSLAADAVRQELEKTKVMLKEVSDHNVVLNEEVQKDQRMILTLNTNIHELSDALQKVTEQSQKPVYKPWYIKVLEFLHK
jgi:hypothetical protein